MTVSLFDFFLSIEVQDIINSLRYINVVKTTATVIRKPLLDVNFGLEIASVMQTSSKNLGKNKKFWTFLSRLLQLYLMSVAPY